MGEEGTVCMERERPGDGDVGVCGLMLMEVVF